MGRRRAELPDLGAVVKRLRTQRNLSIRDVAKGSELSPSFLSALERGSTDVSIGRLSRIAEFFDQDLGSLLGFSASLTRPNFISKSERTLFDRGHGVHYELLRPPGLNLDIVLMTLQPGAAFESELAHDGIDLLLVTSGNIVLHVSGVDYPMATGDCATYSGAYPHAAYNRSSRVTRAIGITTARM
jgi:transcriptional regulator with XRE-family HTH domain